MLNLSLTLCFFADISIDVMELKTFMAGCVLGVSINWGLLTHSCWMRNLSMMVSSAGVQNTHSCYFFKFSAQPWPVVFWTVVQTSWWNLWDKLGSQHVRGFHSTTQPLSRMWTKYPMLHEALSGRIEHQSWVNFYKNLCPFLILQFTTVKFHTSRIPCCAVEVAFLPRSFEGLSLPWRSATSLFRYANLLASSYNSEIVECDMERMSRAAIPVVAPAFVSGSSSNGCCGVTWLLTECTTALFRASLCCWSNKCAAFLAAFTGIPWRTAYPSIGMQGPFCCRHSSVWQPFVTKEGFSCFAHVNFTQPPVRLQHLEQRALRVRTMEHAEILAPLLYTLSREQIRPYFQIFWGHLVIHITEKLQEMKKLRTVTMCTVFTCCFNSEVWLQLASRVGNPLFIIMKWNNHVKELWFQTLFHPPLIVKHTLFSLIILCEQWKTKHLMEIQICCATSPLEDWKQLHLHGLSCLFDSSWHESRVTVRRLSVVSALAVRAAFPHSC